MTGIQIDPTDDPRIVRISITPYDGPPPKSLTEALALEIILSALSDHHSDDLILALDSISSKDAYFQIIQSAREIGSTPPHFRLCFRTAWSVRSHIIREIVDDDDLIRATLRILLPPYHGTAQTLYRGEQALRFRGGRLGFNWSSNKSTAEQFARGLCSDYEGGGILLTAFAPANAIFTGPGEHSNWMGEAEFIVDPTLLSDIRELRV
ncbi:hypothetical protein [Azorhizobium sp. AG788]|uniref:hypothetical protein n=1 Tax=Azorhizobium sp. AG788 TaxID=2183897 RepID=UPI0031393D2A